MAQCTLSNLQADACSNGFTDLSRGDQLNVALALVHSWTDSDATLAELYAQACSNGFNKLSQGDQYTLLLQLLCDISGG